MISSSAIGSTIACCGVVQKQTGTQVVSGGRRSMSGGLHLTARMTRMRGVSNRVVRVAAMVQHLVPCTILGTETEIRVGGGDCQAQPSLTKSGERRNFIGVI